MTKEQIAWIQKSIEKHFNDADDWSASNNDTLRKLDEAEEEINYAEKLFNITLDRTFIIENRKI